MQLLDLFSPVLHGQRADVALEVDAASGSAATTTYTFGDLDDASNRMARALEFEGLIAGDRLCVMLPNGVDFLELLLACLKLGVIFVPINVLYREREVAHVVGDAEPKLVVATSDALLLFPPQVKLRSPDAMRQVAAACAADAVRRSLDGDAPAALVYTSGTTGRSKGAVLSHNNFLANTANLLACWRITNADRYLAALPLFHVHGLANGVMSWLASGCRMRLAERFDIRRAQELFEAFRPTLYFGVPTMYVRLLDWPEEAARRIGEHMRLFVSGSAPLPAHVHEAFQARFGHKILERYGMSETLMLIGNSYAGERRPGSVGVPFPGVSARVVDDQDTDVADGVVGELLVRGSTVCSGYWRQPQATSAAFRDGWFRTHDLAERSPDGYYTLRGRQSDLIISGGFNIYPREIEDVLLEIPGVREAVVVGAPDTRRGEVPVAYLVVSDAHAAADAEAACRKHLASFKMPRAFLAVDGLPRNALGKIQKHLLPAWHSP